MKKLFLLSMMCLLALVMNAQRCAVLEFKAGVGISQSDVDGISAIFITYFQPSGYTMVERTQIDKVIEEQGFQRSNMTQSQMVRVGQILNVSKIVVGDINVVMGQYNVDARVINVESGTIAATEGETFSGSSYRTTMQNIAQKLAGKIAIKAGVTVSSTTAQQSQSRTDPYVIYGYLKVFPTDLGTFDAEPKTVIANINQSQQYGYGTWRLPSNEELQLMRANNIIGSGNYMTKENKKGTVRLVTDKGKGEVLTVPVGYVDLGLPSGTLWKDKDEDGYYTYNQAVAKYGTQLPTKEQLKELKNSCQWTRTGSGYRAVGPSGAFIVLPVGPNGEYWSSTPYSSGGAWFLYFDSDKVGVACGGQGFRYSVRLVQD